MSRVLSAKTWFLPALQLLLLICFVFPATRSAMRDNDQASIISGALQINAGQVSPFHDTLYNFDKQYGSFFLLAGVYRLLPHLDPTLLSNVLLVVLYSIGSLVAFYSAQNHGLSRILGLVLVLTPSMIVYAPFLGTSQLSLAFLLLGFPFLRRRTGPGFFLGLFCLACATAMRVDALFCVPAIYTAISARRTLRQVVVDRCMWLLVAAAALPFIAGRLIVPSVSSDQADHFFIPSYYVALLVFAIGLPWLLSAASFALFGLRSARQRPRWSVFYVTMAISLWWGMAYYAIQMYSARYFFPAFFCSLILFSSHRGRCWFRSIQRSPARSASWVVPALVVLSAAPWFIGIHMRSAKRVLPSVLRVSTMPTSDGLLPMGAYAVFEARMIRNHEVVDHNQQTLDAARTVRYTPCSNGHVALYVTPMVNYLEEAAEEQGFLSSKISTATSSPGCSKTYIDLRSLMRKEVPLGPLLNQGFTWESAPNSTRPILSVESGSPPNPLTFWVSAVVSASRGMDATYYALSSQRPDLHLTLDSELAAITYTDSAPCVPSGSSLLTVAGSPLIWAAISPSPGPRRIHLCAHEHGGFFQGEVPQFMQKSQQ